MNVFIGVIFGCLIGWLITFTFIKRSEPKYAGVLCLHDSKSEGQIELYLELSESPEGLIDCEYVNFKVKKIDI